MSAGTAAFMLEDYTEAARFVARRVRCSPRRAMTRLIPREP